MVKECDYCQAYHFTGEETSDKEFEACCKKGDAVLDPLRVPLPYLKDLYQNPTDPISREFRQHIRSYNSALAFTSVSYNKDLRLNLTAGIQCFQIHGDLFHYQGPLDLSSQEAPQFAQLFFYDSDFATRTRHARNPTLNPTTLRALTDMLFECNPFIPLYQTARERLRTQTTYNRIILNPQMRLVVESGADRRRENLPTSTEVAAILPNEFGEASRRDIILAIRNPSVNGPQLKQVHVTHAAYMPLHYVLLFPYGDYGWHYDLHLRERRGARSRTRLEQRTFYRYRLHTRNGQWSPFFYAGRLFQQYIVDAFVACETTALTWLRTHQSNIRADVYNGLADTLIQQDVRVSDVGRRFILPASYTGSDRFMQQLFQDSMAIVRFFGKPTFFITLTANPRWPEILAELFPGQQPTDRPDLVARVFRLKVRELLTDLKNGLFGPYAAHVYTIEYQKRGLPHLHCLLFLKPAARFLTPERIDQVVCAELPDPAWDPTGELTDVVTAQMTHGPCGTDYPNAPCMVRPSVNAPLRCQKRFPKAFTPETIVSEDGYPQYRRRDNGQTFAVRKPGAPDQQIVRDNRWVVPYNPYLLQKYRSHINVEVCATVSAVKYIHKYVYKGTDRTTLAVAATEDEIARYVQGRYIGPTEAFWRLFEYPSHQEWPPVQHLAVHLEGQQTVYFADDLTPSQIAAKAASVRSTLMAYFDYNREHEYGRQYLYSEYPRHFTWIATARKWQIRKQGNAIGRMYHCSPISGERYYLRLLLTAVRGATSFADLYEYEGTRYATYQEACVARGLAEDDQEWIACFDEAILFTLGHGLRTLFLSALRQRMFTDPLQIWTRYRVAFCDDLRHLLTQRTGFPLPLQDPECDYGLYLLNQNLAGVQSTLADFGLPLPTFDWTAIDLQTDPGVDLAAETTTAARMRAQLNPDQEACFETVRTAIADDPQTAHFYLQGPGGTGKTFLYQTLCHYYRGLGKKVLCVASTGIAALLLPNGRTSHSTFKIPIDLHESSVSHIRKQTQAGQILKETDLIIWDEVPMQHKYCFEVVHRLLVDLRSVTDDVLFGGVPVILGGDFAQILPVVPKGSRADVVAACLQRTSIWSRLRKIHLRTNMRVRNGPHDQPFVRWISELPYNPSLNGPVILPEYISQLGSISLLIDQIYPEPLLTQAISNFDVLNGRAILTTLNTSVTELNTLILSRVRSDSRTYLSVDSADVNEASADLAEIPVEHLQSIDLPTLPLSRLELKVGAPITLLRNLNPQAGLCNGTRSIVVRLNRYSIQARILGGQFHGQVQVIPRIKLIATDDTLGFTLSRKQFPVRLCFAMTINKSQGQSLSTVGLDLRTPVFSHGQFYVAVSRTSSVEGLYVVLAEGSRQTTNIVYPEVLQEI